MKIQKTILYIASCTTLPFHPWKKYELIHVSMAADKKFTNFIFFWHLGCFLLFAIRSLPSREGSGGEKKKKPESETCCRKCRWHYYPTLSWLSYDVINSHISNPNSKVSSDEMCLLKSTTQKPTVYPLLGLNHWQALLPIPLNGQLSVRQAAGRFGEER